MKSDTVRCVLIFVLSLIAFTIGLQYNEFIKIDVRFALFTSEIAKYGLGLFPTLNGSPYTDYTVLPIYLMYLASLKATCVNMLTTVIPSAIAASLTLVFTYLIGLKRSQEFALRSVFMCFFAYTFLATARDISLDMYVCLAMTIAFYLVYTSSVENKKIRLFWLPLVFIFGFAMRGPVGMIVPASVVVIYCLLDKKWILCVIFALTSIILCLLCMSVFFYLCYETGGKELLKLFLQNQIFGRFDSGPPPWYYLTNALGTYSVTYPLGIIVILFYLKKLFKEKITVNDNFMFLVKNLTIWVVVILLIFSTASGKHLRYIMAIVPAVALLSALIFENKDKFVVFDFLKMLLLFVCKIAPILGFIVVIALGIISYKIKMGPNFHVILPAIEFIIWSLIVFIICKKFKGPKLVTPLLFSMVVSMVLIQINIAEKINIDLETSKQFVNRIQEIKHKYDMNAYFFDLGPDNEDLKYLANIPDNERPSSDFYIMPGYVAPDTVEDNTSLRELEKNFSLVNLVHYFINQLPDIKHKPIPKMFNQYGLSEINKVPENTIFICKEKDYQNSMPNEMKKLYTIVLRGKLGHQDCLAFIKNPLPKGLTVSPYKPVFIKF